MQNQGGYQDPNANAGYQQNNAPMQNQGGYQAPQNSPGQHVDPNAGHQNNAPGYNTAMTSPTNQPNQQQAPQQQQINPAGDFLNGPQ